MPSIIDKTDPGQWDQLIVLSQNVVNTSFEQMWRIASLDPDSPLNHFKYPTRIGEVDVYPGPPKVKLQVTQREPMLYFELALKSGSVGFYLTNDPQEQMTRWEVKDWTWVFPVSIGRKTVGKETREYENFKQRAGLPNSVFTLQQLYVDSSSSTKMDVSRSNFGSFQNEFSRLTPEARAAFDTFISGWLSIASQKNQSILGYSVQDKDEELNDYAPSFPPTSIDYYSYPWKGENGSSAPVNDLDQNGLSYLMMSANRTPPDGQVLNYSGAWVDGTNSTFCMNQSNFWGWLNPVLRSLAMAMTVVPTEPYVEWDNSDPDHPWSSGMRYNIGDTTTNASEYSFSWSPWIKKWVWSASNSAVKSKTAYNPGNRSNYMTLKEWTTGTAGTLSFSGGTEKITLDGTSTFHFRADHTAKRPTYTEMTFTITWSFVVAMASVEDGGVVFVPTSDPDVNVTNRKDGGMSWNPPPDVVAERFRSGLDNRLDSAFESVHETFRNALRNQHRLFLPGQGSFLMKDPKFNARGDLIVALEYNGADPPTRHAVESYRSVMSRKSDVQPAEAQVEDTWMQKNG